jgi:hypothetical protein
MIWPAKVSRSTIAAQSRGSVKVLVPSGERFVGRDGDRQSLLSFGQDLEEEFGATPVEFHVSQLVQTQKIDAAFRAIVFESCLSSAASPNSFTSLEASV